MNLVWDLQEIPAPPPRKKPEDQKGQAASADPNMFFTLELHLKESIEQGKEDRLALMSQWLAVFGIRTKHVKRSVLIKITKSFATGYCARGKQQHARNGFVWSAPSCLCNFPGFNWAERLLQDFQRVPDKQKYLIGLCFDVEKMAAWSNDTICNMVRSYFPHLPDAQDITTYTWRRLSSTLATSSKLSAQEKLALSDWVDKTQGDKAEAIPLRYADSKAMEARRIKGDIGLLLAQLKDPST